MKKMLLGCAVVLGVLTLLFVVSFGIFLYNYDDKHRKVTDAITPESQRALKADPAMIMERRKQYIAQYDELWRTDDYATVMRKAKEGNPIAQRRLYEIYQFCIDMRTSGTVPMLAKIATVNKKMAVAYSELKAEQTRFCGPNTGGPHATGQARAFWMRESAKRGDLVSEMRVTVGEAKTLLTHAQVEDFIRRTIVSGDPYAIMEIGSLLPRMKQPWPEPNIAPAMQGDLASHAWIIVACRAGMDCKRGSRVMTNTCIRTMICSYDDYFGFVATDGVHASKLPELARLGTIVEQIVLNPARIQ